MKKYLLVIPAVIVATGVIQFQQSSADRHDAYVAGEQLALSAPAEDANVDLPYINHPVKTPKKSLARLRLKAEKAKFAPKKKALQNEGDVGAVEKYVPRTPVTQQDMDAAIFQGGTNPRAREDASSAASSQLPTAGDKSLDDLLASDRWVTKLSGSQGILYVQKERTSLCSQGDEKCNEIAERREVSVVGVVVRSEADNTYAPAPMRGKIHSGQFANGTPAIYVD